MSLQEGGMLAMAGYAGMRDELTLGPLRWVLWWRMSGRIVVNDCRHCAGLVMMVLRVREDNYLPRN